MTEPAFDVEASIAEQLAKHEAQRAALAIREKTFDLQFESYGRKGGSGHCWMTETQLERAATRLSKSTRAGGKTDYAAGKSDLAMDSSLVAQAYLSEFVRYRDSHELIHRAAEHFKNDPPRPRVDLTKLKMKPTIQLASGVYFDFIEPHTTPLSVLDIAAGLSRICRYTGHLAIDEDDIYSVGQHSVLASENCGDDCDPFEALMHDRVEAVMNDMSSPLKQLLPDYKEIEDRCEEETAIYYGVPHPMTDACKRIDIRMLATEKRDLMPGDIADDKWAIIKDVTPLPFRITPWRPKETRWRFIHRYYYLTEGRIPDQGAPYAVPHPNAPAEYVEAVFQAWGEQNRGAMGMPTTVAV